MISFANLLCVLLTYLINREFFLDVHMNLMQFMCNERNMVFVMLKQQMKYILSRTKIKKKIIKRHFCLSFSLLYLFIRSCKFVIIETRFRHSTWRDRDELINHLKYMLRRKQPPVFHNRSYSLKFCSAHRKIPVLESLFSKEF